MATRLRTLGPRDLWAIQEFLLQRPVENLFLTYKLHQYGVDERALGFFHGFERDGQLTAVCMDGGPQASTRRRFPPSSVRSGKGATARPFSARA